MEFLYKLYSNDYFGIGLFIVITILAFSFLVILFFGKKDEKARKEELNNNVDTINNSNNDQTVQPMEQQNLQESLSSMTLASNPAPMPVEEPINQPIPNENSGFFANTNVSSEQPKENNEVQFAQQPIEPNIDPFNSTPILTEPVSPNLEQPKVAEPMFAMPAENVEPSPKVEEEIPQLNQSFFDQPSESLNSESSNSGLSVFDQSPIIEPINQNSPVSPIIEEQKEDNIFSSVNLEDTNKKINNSQFSSVYVNNTVDAPTNIISNNPTPDNTSSTVVPKPLKPEFDLPKPFDLPKLNKDSNTSNDSIIKASNTVKTNENLTNIFGNLEEDSYNINE